MSYRTRDGYRRPPPGNPSGPLPDALREWARSTFEEALRRAERIGNEEMAAKARELLCRLAETDMRGHIDLLCDECASGLHSHCRGCQCKCPPDSV